MKQLRILIGVGFVLSAGLFIISADHIDAPAVTGGSSDITDIYTFQGEDTNNIVFVANVQGFLSPMNTENAQFDENVLIEFNIDTNQDAVEDYVIQAIPKNNKMYVAGPYTPEITGTVSNVEPNAARDSFVKITPYGSDPIVKETRNGLHLFAGPRDDPFFFDFSRFVAILTDPDVSGFDESVAADTFAGTNVLSVVVEVPKSFFGNSDKIDVWVETKRKQ